ncbi:MAG TPA: ATP-binding protein, partial [Solirubrobacteraceae bacterium]
PSLKLKLGLVIVMAIVVTLATLLIAAKLGLRLRWGAAVALVVSLASVQLVARGLVSPLRAMADASEAMARGEHGQRVAVASRDEVGQLAAAFNRMAAEVELLDRVRRDFVADAAHELRTPISALRASLENAVDGVEPADPAALLAQVERLGRLTDQLLDLSRLEAGAAGLAPRAFPVAELLDGCGADVDAPAGLRARGDPDRLRQVVANLVDNAHRHAPGSPVVVRAREAAGGGVTLEVEDRGPGLEAGEAERIFDRFARADRARSTAGAGLGLAIARSIVELHGGAIRAEPAVPRGCRMVVELP